MGFSGSVSTLDPATPLARPLYRDDDDGMQALRLQQILHTDLDPVTRRRLLDRLDRALDVTGGRWAALLVAGDRDAQVLVAGEIPPLIHRQLGELKLRGGEQVTFPAYIISRAASQGYAVEGAPILGSEALYGYIVLGIRLAEKRSEQCAELVRLVADDLSGLLDSTRLAGQIERIKSHLSLVHRLGQQVTSIHDRVQLLEEITRLVHRSLGYEHIQLLLTNEEAGTIDLVHASGPFAKQLMGAGFREMIGRGIIGRVAESGRIKISTDVSQDSHFISHPLLPNTASEFALPLRLGSRIIGVLDIQSDRRDAFRRDDVIILQTIADQIAPAIEQNRLFAAERQERELANTLADVSRIISSSLEPTHVLEAILNELRRVVPHQGCRVMLRADDGTMRVVAARGYPTTSW
jgi:GAF domain-containing protein